MKYLTASLTLCICCCCSAQAAPPQSPSRDQMASLVPQAPSRTVLSTPRGVETPADGQEQGGSYFDARTGKWWKYQTASGLACDPKGNLLCDCPCIRGGVCTCGDNCPARLNAKKTSDSANSTCGDGGCRNTILQQVTPVYRPATFYSPPPIQMMRPSYSVPSYAPMMSFGGYSGGGGGFRSFGGGGSCRGGG
jgi:hypothetical protein